MTLNFSVYSGYNGTTGRGTKGGNPSHSPAVVFRPEQRTSAVSVTGVCCLVTGTDKFVGDINANIFDILVVLSGTFWLRKLFNISKPGTRATVILFPLRDCKHNFE